MQMAIEKGMAETEGRDSVHNVNREAVARQRVLEGIMESEYLIWSIEHTAWWKPNRYGYTQELREAGVYGKAEAEEIVEESNKYGQFHECMIPKECFGLVI